MRELNWPVKTRELVTRLCDSTVWNGFEFRDDDIVIATYAKSGTTWMQQIVAQLVFNGAPEVEVHMLSPWLEARHQDRHEVLAKLAAQRNRRFIKTHLPIDALVYSPRAKYIVVARDGRDALWSFFDHHSNLTRQALDRLNTGPARLGPRWSHPKSSVRDYFLDWLARDGYPIWPFWNHIQGWYEAARLPNLLVVHYADLKAALPAQIRRIADFLEIAVAPGRLPAIVEHCSFDYMKAHAGQVVPGGGARWKGGARTFMNKGTNGRWHDVLTEADVARYEREARNRLGERLAEWLAEGGPLPLTAAYSRDLAEVR